MLSPCSIRSVRFEARLRRLLNLVFGDLRFHGACSSLQICSRAETPGWPAYFALLGLLLRYRIGPYSMTFIVPRTHEGSEGKLIQEISCTPFPHPITSDAASRYTSMRLARTHRHHTMRTPPLVQLHRAALARPIRRQRRRASRDEAHDPAPPTELQRPREDLLDAF